MKSVLNACKHNLDIERFDSDMLQLNRYLFNDSEHKQTAVKAPDNDLCLPYQTATTQCLTNQLIGVK